MVVRYRPTPICRVPEVPSQEHISNVIKSIHNDISPTCKRAILLSIIANINVAMKTVYQKTRVVACVASETLKECEASLDLTGSEAYGVCAKAVYWVAAIYALYQICLCIKDGNPDKVLGIILRTALCAMSPYLVIQVLQYIADRFPV